MNDLRDVELYLSMLSNWASNVARIIKAEEITHYKKQFKHDATAHAEKLKQLIPFIEKL